MLKTMILIAAVAIAPWTLPAASHAGSLTTPLMFSGTNTTVFFCEGANVGTKPIKSVTVSLVQPGNPPISDTCPNLAPTQFCQITAVPPAFFSGFCRVTFTGGKQGVRGAMSVVGAGNNVLATQSAN